MVEFWRDGSDEHCAGEGVLGGLPHGWSVWTWCGGENLLLASSWWHWVWGLEHAALELWPVCVWRWSCRSWLCLSSLENEEAFVFQEWSDLEGELTARKSSSGACWREDSPMEFCWPHALLAILLLCLSSNSNERQCVRSPSRRGATDINCLQLFT